MSCGVLARAEGTSCREGAEGSHTAKDIGLTFCLLLGLLMVVQLKYL